MSETESAVRTEASDAKPSAPEITALKHTEPVKPAISINAECDPTVSYASHQNAVPVIHHISVENCSDAVLNDLEVVVSVTPSFADGLRFRYEQLHPGERRQIRPVNLKLLHSYLIELNEAEKGEIRFTALVNGEQRVELIKPIEVLAYDQWGGTRSVPELLCAFCMPNHPHVDRLIADASILLERSGAVAVFNGYDSRNREHVWAQISAIAAVIMKRGIQYSLPPASFASDGQKIRTPDRLLDGGLATCLDMTMLMASALEAIHLNPVILLKDGHAWLGCWLVNTSFPTCLTDDALSVRKRVDAGEFIAIETTLFENRGNSLKLAVERGYHKLANEEEASQFLLAIDLYRARAERILPLPSRGALYLADRDIASIEVEVEAAPALPPLSGETILLDDEPLVETPTGRLGRWMSKLLDLTLRNRLLNFKPNKLTLKLMVPDPATLEDTLADGQEWKFRAAPPLMEGDDPRSRELTRGRHGQDPVEEMARQALAEHELLVRMDQKQLNATLNDLYLTVRTSLEESGANTLFLALGFLKWAEDETSEKMLLAPLILVPVTLKRRASRSGFSIERHDDETVINPTLLQALKERFDMNLRGLDPIPTDGSGVNVAKIWRIFEEAIKVDSKWDIVKDVYLGVFSFHKHVMWSSLRNRQEALRQNKLVNHLIDRPRESFGGADIRHCADLDDRYAPGAFFAPLSCDSSQLNAVRRADEGHDFVMEGPPGTGKSQTITNIIVDKLAKGQRVLFVSEKMAALQVVERRLRGVGLGPFCLQLHSSKANKAEVTAQLSQTMNLVPAAPADGWEAEAERLGRLRNELNAVVLALHRRHPNGLTVYEALGTAIGHPQWPAPKVTGSDQLNTSRTRLDQIRELAKQMQAIAVHIGNLSDTPLRTIEVTNWSNRWEEELLACSQDLQRAVVDLRTAIQTLEPFLHYNPEAGTASALEGLDMLAGTLLQAPQIPVGFARVGDDPALRRRVTEARERGVRRNAAICAIADLVKPDVAKLNADELDEAWAIAGSKWFLPRWLGKRKVSDRFIRFSITGKRPAMSEIPRLIAGLKIVNEQDRALAKAETDIKPLLESTYRAEDTDWDQVEQFEQWGALLERATDLMVPATDPVAKLTLATAVREIAAAQRNQLGAGGQIATVLLQVRDRYARFMEVYTKAVDLTGNARLCNRTADHALPTLEAAARSWRDQRVLLRDWVQWNRFRQEAAQLGLAEVFREIERGTIEPLVITTYIDYCCRVTWLKDTIDGDDLLRNFSGAVHEQKIRDFREADRSFQDLSVKLAFAKMAASLTATRNKPEHSGEVVVLERASALQNNRLPIRQLIRGIPNLLPALKPCMLMSPLSAAQYLDPATPLFDVVVFDEGSQMPVWDAVGAIALGKQLIVAGDPKQLPPSSFFERGDHEEETFDDESAPPQELESILDECLTIGMSRLSLDWHYRSAHESLITFSNAKYYDGRLITFPSPATQDTSVKMIQVNGVYDRGGTRTNRAEADAVVRRIVEHLSSDDPSVHAKTVGVITFNATQARLIDQLMQTEFARNPVLEERDAAHGDEKLMIKNLEQSQGDERDIILFSTTFGKDAAGRSTLQFGPIAQRGGERRLNVAVTRARHQVEVYSSLRPEEIDLSRTRAQGVSDLKAYLEYALRGPGALASESVPTGREPDSLFERQVIAAIRQAGWEVHPQVGCSGFRIDIGVVDKGAPGRYLVGVECDGATYHGLASARDRDRLRQIVLEGLGWTIERVWSTDWWFNPQRCTAKLLAKIEQLQFEADQVQAQAQAQNVT